MCMSALNSRMRTVSVSKRHSGIETKRHRDIETKLDPPLHNPKEPPYVTAQPASAVHTGGACGSEASGAGIHGHRIAAAHGRDAS